MKKDLYRNQLWPGVSELLRSGAIKIGAPPKEGSKGGPRDGMDTSPRSTPRNSPKGSSLEIHDMFFSGVWKPKGGAFSVSIRDVWNSLLWKEKKLRQNDPETKNLRTWNPGWLVQMPAFLKRGPFTAVFRGCFLALLLVGSGARELPPTAGWKIGSFPPSPGFYGWKYWKSPYFLMDDLGGKLTPYFRKHPYGSKYPWWFKNWAGQLRLVVGNPTICRLKKHMPGGLRFLPSTGGPILQEYVATLSYGELCVSFCFAHEIVILTTPDFILFPWKPEVLSQGIPLPCFFRQLVSRKSKGGLGPTPPMPHFS